MKIENGQEYRPYKRFIGSIIPNSLMKYKGISDGAKICFARLCQYNGKNGSAFPSYETLANEMGVNKRTAQRRVEELVGNELISIQYKTGRTNTYKFIWNSKIFEEADVKEESTSDNTVIGEVSDMSLGGDNIVMGGMTNMSTIRESYNENNKENNISDSSFVDISFSVKNYINLIHTNKVFSNTVKVINNSLWKKYHHRSILSEEEQSTIYSYRNKIINHPDENKLVRELENQISDINCSREEFHIEEVLSSILN